MKKEYFEPILEEEKVEIEDVIAASGNANWGGNQPGDRNENWPF